jgi:hypothetical protein
MKAAAALPTLVLGLAVPAHAALAQGVMPDTVEAHLAAGKRVGRP